MSRLHRCVEAASCVQVCAKDAPEEDKENGAMFRCLVASMAAVTDKCSKEVVRSLRHALQFYSPVRLLRTSCLSLSLSLSLCLSLSLPSCVHACGGVLACMRSRSCELHHTTQAAF